ncbi:hypothetical protein [Nonomuraea sp. NEAU-A123]|uniref:hypothetical protein n=1 Tax=Nonomuraea sp. NEAU-A123 TaxID=2839649 RepID=UPI001BE44602|nr:hypothetical protein [Nonomuraea sp. NEAU-A123]MBT2226879.1 hypothetical protein [Nonomuraea sp. NEAU-A123]
MRWASVRPLVVTGVYGTRTRLLVEAEMARRGWAVALSPGEANLVVVCGVPGEGLAQAIRVVWEEVAGPRALVELLSDATPDVVVAALDGAVVALADEPGQRRAAAEREPPSWPMDHGMDHGGMGHGGHEHHMGSPGGVAMADRGPDRDGLKLDRLHVPLGPVLADWPSGLVVETVLQGDVIQQATVHVVGGVAGGVSFWDEPWVAALEGRPVTRGEAERRRAASHLDSIGRLLAVAGWPSAAMEARWLRDRTLAGESRADLSRDHARFARRVRRSKILAWMLRGVGTSAGPGASPEEDVLSRLRRWLDRTGDAMSALDDTTPLVGDDGPRGPVGERPSAAALAVLPRLLDGAELAAARLIVAGLDPDLDQLAQEPLHAV